MLSKDPRRLLVIKIKLELSFLDFTVSEQFACLCSVPTRTANNKVIQTTKLSQEKHMAYRDP